MDVSPGTRPPIATAHASNNMGLVRVILALLVIVAHSFELTGGRKSELLVRLFGTLTFGDVAVDGFFMASGYLITKSFIHSANPLDYLRRRVLRIYPGFIVAYCLSIIVVGPLSGAPATEHSFLWMTKHVFRMALLEYPQIDGAFTGLLVPQLNLSLWTISYEFRCYLLVILLGLIGVLKRGWALPALVAILVLFHLFEYRGSLEYHIEAFVGKPTNDMRLAMLFFVGALFYIYERDIPYSGRWAAMAVVAVSVSLFFHNFAEVGLGIFGGYLLFWFVFKCRPTPYSRFDSHVDLSYGIYLYAFPIQNLLIFSDRTISPWTVLAASAPLSVLCAFISWYVVEKPALQFKGSSSPSKLYLRQVKHLP